MPPIIAFLAYVAFVAWCFRSERGHFNKAGGAVWLPTIWMLYVGSKPIARWIQPYFGGAGTDDSGSAIDRYFLSLLICIAWGILLKRQFTWRLAARQNPWLLVLLGYMLVSVMWSDVPGTAFKRWVREFGTITMSCVLLTEPSPKDAIERVLRRTVVLLVPLSLVLIKYFPELGIEFHRWTGERMWIGVTLQKNGIGRLCLISAFYLVWSLTCRWRAAGGFRAARRIVFADVALLLLTLLLLKGPSLQAYSATAVVSLMAGLATFVCLLWLRARPNWWPLSRAFVVGIALVMVGGTAAPIVLQEASVANAASALGRDATFTGRTEIWAGLIPEAAQNPILGVGFGSFWTSEKEAEHRIGEAHNGYLDLRLEQGFVGVVLVMLVFITSALKALQNPARDWGCLLLCFIVIAVMHNISESSINCMATHLIGLIVFLTMTVNAQSARVMTPRVARGPAMKQVLHA